MKKRKLLIFYDQAVDIHFPAHYKDVYLRLLTEFDLQVTLIAFTTNLDHPLSLELVRQGNIVLKKRSYRTILKRFFYYFSTFKKLIREMTLRSCWKTDLCMVHDDPIFASFCFLLSKKNKGQFIYRISHLKPETAVLESKIKNCFSEHFSGYVAKVLRDFFLRKADHIICMSETMRDYLIKQARLKERDITTVLSMVDTEISPLTPEYSKRLQKIQSHQKHYNVKHWLVYSGNVAPSRHLGFLIDTLKELRRTGCNAGLFILGVASDQKNIDAIIEYALSLEMDKFLLVEEPVPEKCIPHILNVADVGLSPLPIDEVFIANSPLKPLDYMKAKIPVVGSANPDQVELLHKSGGGLIADNNPQSFSAAISSILKQDPFLITKNADAAYKWICKNRSIEKAASQLSIVLKKQ